MTTLKEYKNTSGKLINEEKIDFMLHSNAFNSIRDRIKRLTCFKHKIGPITYLGCPLFVGRLRNTYFSDLVNKVFGRITCWHTKQLNYGGKVVLTKQMLQVDPIHLISAFTPPTTILMKNSNAYDRLFLGLKSERKKYHWDSWNNLSFHYDEGGVGMRNLNDICKAFQLK